MTTIVPTQINVRKLSTGTIEVRIVPPVARVPNNDGKTTAQLVWNLSGGTFVEPFFAWKTAGVLPDVTAVSPVKLQSSVYDKNTEPEVVTWEYEFTVKVDGTETTLLIDPEVENLPPGSPFSYKKGPKGQPGQPGGGQPGGGQPGGGQPGNVNP